MHKRKKKQALALGLLVIIASLLAVLLALLPRGQVEDGVTEVEDYLNAIAEEEIPPDTVSGPGQTSKPDYEDKAPIDDKVPKKKELFVIIDDVGNNLSYLDAFLELPVPVTFAVMPGRPFSEESARRIIKAGFEIILHQPMEPLGGQNPGVGAIVTGMSEDEIIAVLDGNLKGLPSIMGINNHMGSKATADEKTMKSVMKYLSKKGMFFIDSFTTGRSVGEKVAEELNVPYAKRNSVFLDNDDDVERIENALRTGADVAGQMGNAILIGHVKTGALAKVIDKVSQELKDNGYAFRGVSALGF